MPRERELKDAVLDSLGAKIAEYGFVYRARGQSFVRKTPFGRLSYHLNFAGYRTEICILGDLGIRFDALEKLKNELRPDLNAARRRETYSIGTGIGYLYNGDDNSLDVSGYHQVDPATDHLMEMFIVAGLPYLNRYSDMRAVFEGVSDDGELGESLHILADSRACNAVGLAYILGERDKFQELVVKKTAFLEERDDFGLPRFLAFVEYLKKRMQQDDEVQSEA